MLPLEALMVDGVAVAEVFAEVVPTAVVVLPATAEVVAAGVVPLG